MWSFNEKLSPDDQISAEEAIASHIFEAGLQDEDVCAQLGRDILLSVLAEFRPDLVEGPDVKFLSENSEGDCIYREYECDGVGFRVTLNLDENLAQLSYFTPVPAMQCGGVYEPVLDDGWFGARSMAEAEEQACKIMQQYVEEIKNELGI
jgi:hypothetical protein